MVRLGWLGRFGLIVVVKQLQKLGTGHLAQHGGRQRVREGIVVNIGIKPVHHIELGISK